MPWEATYRAKSLTGILENAKDAIAEGIVNAGNVVRTVLNPPQIVTIDNEVGSTVNERISFFRGDKNHLQAIIKEAVGHVEGKLSVGDVIVKVNGTDVTSPTQAANLLSEPGVLVIEKHSKNDDLYSEYRNMEEELSTVQIYKEFKSTPIGITFFLNDRDHMKAIIKRAEIKGSLNVGNEVVSVKNGSAGSQWQHVQDGLDAARKLREAEGYISVVTRPTNAALVSKYKRMEEQLSTVGPMTPPTEITFFANDRDHTKAIIKSVKGIAADILDVGDEVVAIANPGEWQWQYVQSGPDAATKFKEFKEAGGHIHVRKRQTDPALLSKYKKLDQGWTWWE